MNKRKPETTQGAANWRFIVVFASVTLVFLGLVGRTAYIQVIEPDKLIEQGNLRTHRTIANEALRGMITDRNGLELAISVPVNAIYADPKRVIEQGMLTDSSKARAWRALADILETDVDKLKQKIASNPKSRFIYLSRHASPARAEYVNQLKIKGIGLRAESRRYYPAAEVSSQLVGITNLDDKGIEGVEKSYEHILKGTKGSKKVLKDARGQVIDVLAEETATKPKNIQLSIDQRIQTLAYQELKKAVQFYEADSGSAVVIDVKTGELLALVNNPSFNPNNRKTITPSLLRNRAITDTFEPGSTVKPLSILAALEFGSLNSKSIINTSPGWSIVGGRRVRDSKNHGKLDLAGILKKSSNVGTSKIALSLPTEQFLDAYYNAGFGTDTGTGLIGESSGLFFDRRRWSDIEIATLSYGYGLSTTSIQLAQMYATIANGGIRRPLSIIKLDKPHHGERVFSQSATKQLIQMMESVLDKDGSGFRASVNGYRVAGKTGTSRKAAAGGYGDDYMSLFAGLAPISNPQLALVVVINNPKGDTYYGGEVAAPTFSRIMSGALQLLNVPTDKQNNADLEIAQVKVARNDA